MTPRDVTMIEALVQLCIAHGGFSHGHSARLCPACRAWLETWFNLQSTAEALERKPPDQGPSIAAAAAWRESQR